MTLTMKLGLQKLMDVITYPWPILSYFVLEKDILICRIYSVAAGKNLTGPFSGHRRQFYCASSTKMLECR